ncbi:MAG: O-antigen ligase family protein [Synergistaceae bacterium]|nr:O-antigen ligase family protein [Synergistaceae bacterium]
MKKTLVPVWLYYGAFFITFTAPNLVFSGERWFDTLHIMKWFVAMAPIGVISVVAGINLFRFGFEKTGFTIDPFAFMWFFLVFLIISQPVFIHLSSSSTFAKEWFFFATLFAVYILAYNLRPGGGFLRALLWGSSINAAVNVVFAELMIRNITTGMPFIMNVPGNYIGNTGQQEMMGLWVAMAVLNGLFLHVHYICEWRAKKSSRFLLPANIVVFLVNTVGLWRTTSRGAILGLVLSCAVMFVCFLRSRNVKATAHLLYMFLIAVLFLGVILAINPFDSTNRGGTLVQKMLDMVKNPGTFGDRIAIWRVSNEIFLKNPIAGVGLGHYKWHFLEGQRDMFEKYPALAGNPNYKWQFTYWAHSEYLQWLCETGIIGAVILGLMALWWLHRFLYEIVIKRKEAPPEAVWGCAMIFMLFFDALFSRPFHRIENAVWMSLAFALANRSILPDVGKWMAQENKMVYRAFGALFSFVAICGLIFLGGGMRGDKLMLGALITTPPEAKLELLDRAEWYLMSREEAREMKAELDIIKGLQMKNPDSYLSGVAQFYEVFKARPNSERLYKLFDYAMSLDSAELVEELAPYMPQESVRLR